MAYGEKYKYYFYWNHDSANNYYKVSFLEDGYASTVTTLTPGVNPFIRTIDGHKDSIDQVLLGSSASMEIIVDRLDVDTIDGDFMSISYKDVIVKLIEDPDGTPVVKWVGILLPQNSTREFLGYKFSYNLSAMDGIGNLKNFYYSGNGLQDGVVYQGFDDLLTIIKTAISKLADFSDLQLDFRVQLGTYSDQMVSTENALKENEVVQELFYTVDSDGKNQIDTCYDVIKKILRPFNCLMSQADGYYQIWNPQERSSYYFEYDWSTLTQQSRTTRDRTITFEGAITGYELFGRGSLSKLPPQTRHNITLYNREYSEELITNGGFDSTITGWTNGDAPTSASTWNNTFQWYNYPGWYGTLDASYAGAGAAASYYFHNTSSFTLTVGAGAGTVTATVQSEWNSSAGGGSQFPNVRMRLWNSTDGYLTGTNGYIGFFGLIGFQDFGEVFDVSGLTTAANFLEIEVQITDATDTAIQFYFDNVTITQTLNTNPYDRLFRGVATGEEFEVKDEILYISDQQDNTADICSLKDAGGNYTSSWDRYNETDTLSLIDILHQQHFNERSTFQDYIRATAYDPDQTIDIFSTLFLNELDLPVRYADIVGMNMNYRTATIELEIRVGGAEVTDVSFNTVSLRLNSQYGESL